MSDLNSGFQKVLLAHAQRYPAWQAQDVYKLAHQAALGSEHALISAEQARLRLEEEISGLEAGPAEPLLDAISADGRLVRVHLRPYVGAGLPAAALAEAFVRTATGFKGSVEVLEQYLAQATALAKDLSIAPAALEELIAGMRQKGFSAMHHSEVFRRQYAPAYRVVEREWLVLE
jgi:hypothetical protein